MTASYPNTRMRRTRASTWSRNLHRETVMTSADLIWPLFVTEGEGQEEPIASLPGVSRWSVDGIVARAREAVELGIPVVALFPNTPKERPIKTAMSNSFGFGGGNGVLIFGSA